MSLVGSLEDLGLGDILQIVSLARKSGRLVLRTDGEAGWIILCEGQVRGAAIKGHSDDLRSLLLGSGEVSAEAFDAARDVAAERDVAMDVALVDQGALSAERLDALRRERVERSVMNMFLWRTGEFSFEVRDAVDPQDEDLMLSSGINTQYLAMEATRLRDEGELLGPPDLDEEPLFSGEEPAAVPVASAPEAEAPIAVAEDSPVEAMALASVRGVEHEEGGDGEDSLEAPADVDVQETRPGAPEPIAVSVRSRASGDVPADMPPIVALDGDLVGLEWFKAQTTRRFPRVHIFQNGEQAMDRVRRYLMRNVVPLVIASPRMLQEQDAGRDLLTRLRSLAPAMPVLGLLSERGGEPPEGVSGCVRRPVGLGTDPETWSVHAERAQELLEALVDASRSRPARRSVPRADASLESLRSVSDRLRDPERRDDVLTVVLEFAARSLSRVAVFMLRDDQLMGMAERGISGTGGPDDEGMRSLVLGREELPELFLEALETRRGARGALAPGRDAGLLARLGGSTPVESYVAPIESGGSPVALIYGDNLPRDIPIGDTTALEIVLHEAGLALDRASLELALAAVQDES
jgi:hypothetical protein